MVEISSINKPFDIKKNKYINQHQIFLKCGRKKTSQLGSKGAKSWMSDYDLDFRHLHNESVNQVNKKRVLNMEK